ncbi:Uncharacterized protein APZ42_031538 [Daphnia magna]|uniref:HTH psq-type domain-containing protein n=1 Tax=Daphnia magna TaxID=35525 RepID=A0A164MSH9_9CRUS|nr:Uncharacterized protein APZ42_031538 [Daphnia magna]
MAAVEHADNLSVREDFFVTFDENTGNCIFWLFDTYTGRFFNSETAKFFVFPVLPAFDSCCLPVGSDCMPRNYIRKTVKDEHQEEKLKIAICEVLSGRSSIRKAAERYGLAKSTIGSYSKPSTRVFFDNLCALMAKHHFKPNEIWNCDENNDTTVNEPPKVIAVKGTKQVSSKVVLLRLTYTKLVFICKGAADSFRRTGTPVPVSAIALPIDSGTEVIPVDAGTNAVLPINAVTAALPIDMVTPAVLPIYSGIPASQSMVTNTPVVLPRELQPLPQVPQNTPMGPRPRSNRRLGRTRILTDTPEKDLIEQEHKKMEEKKRKVSEKKNIKEGLENEKKKVSCELLPKKK